MPTIILLGGALLVLILMVVVLVFVVRGGSSGDRLDDLNSLIDSEWRPGPQDQVVVGGGKTAREQMAEKLDSALAKRGLAGNIRGQLRKADLKLTVAEYLILHLVSAALLGMIAFILRQNPALFGVGAVIGLFVPRVVVSIMQGNRLKSFQNQLPDILNLWVNSLRAGFSVPQAMEAVSREAPEPAATEFKRVVAEI